MRQWRRDNGAQREVAHRRAVREARVGFGIEGDEGTVAGQRRERYRSTQVAARRHRPCPEVLDGRVETAVVAPSGEHDEGAFGTRGRQGQVEEVIARIVAALRHEATCLRYTAQRPCHRGV